MNHYNKGFLAVTCFLLASFSGAQELRIGIAENRDGYTNALGLGQFLADEGRSFTDFSSDFSGGVVPDLSEIDLFIVGSFLTNNNAMKQTYIESGAILREFVRNGGTVVILTQADQDHALESWPEPPRTVLRADPDAATVQRLQPEHALLNTPESVLDSDLTGWQVSFNNTVAWEAFRDFALGAVILADDDQLQMMCLIEMGWGSGRALFSAMALDKAYAIGNATSKNASIKLLRNMLAYAEAVRKGTAKEIILTPSRGYKHPVRGTVYRDENGNGLRDEGEVGWPGVGVSDGRDVVLTDSEGHYFLPNTAQDAEFVFVVQPDEARLSPDRYYHLISDDHADSNRFDFGLNPWPAGKDLNRVRFVQISDVHTANDGSHQTAGLEEIYNASPPVDFIAATGDLTADGLPSHYDNYVAALGEQPVPVVQVYGNHDMYPKVFWERLGLDYYSFNQGGVHFIVLNNVAPWNRQDVWLDATIAQFGQDRPVVVFQHYPPGTPGQFESLASRGVQYEFSGHWHSEKVVSHAGLTSINSPAFIMGGIDCSPAGYKVVEMDRSGLLRTEWHFGGVSNLATIVSPSAGLSVNRLGFPILVNAFDSSRSVESVHWRLLKAGVERAAGLLDRRSLLAWSGQYTGSGQNLPDGLCDFEVEVRDSEGQSWKASHLIMLDRSEPTIPQPSAEWPVFMGHPSHAALSGLSLTPPLRLAWAIDTGGDPDFSSPILAEGRLYVALKRRGTERWNGVAAFDPSTGREIWRTLTEQAINHTPAYVSGVICVAEVGGRVLGLNAATGAEIWRHTLKDAVGRFNYSAPVADAGKFYVGTLAWFARIDAGTGSVDWERALSNNGSDWISSCASPAVAGDRLLVGGNWAAGPDLVVVNKHTGVRQWSHAADNGMHGGATVSGNSVLFSTISSRLYHRNLSNGAASWDRALGSGWSATTPAVAGDTVVAASGNGVMRAYRLSTGALLWTHNAGDSVFKLSPYRRDRRGLFSSPTIAGDFVFFGSDDGTLTALNLETGAKVWSFRIGVPVMSTPLVSGNALYVCAMDGRLYAFTPGSTEAPLAATLSWNSLE